MGQPFDEQAFIEISFACWYILLDDLYLQAICSLAKRLSGML